MFNRYVVFVLILTIVNIFIFCRILFFGHQESNNGDSICYCHNQVSSIDDALDATTNKVSDFMLKLKPKLDKNVSHVFAMAITKASYKHNVNPLYAATISFLESSFNPAAVSSSGAKGLFQVIEKFHKSDSTIMDFGINADDGVRVLKRCLNVSNNNCVSAYICYIYGETGLKLKMYDELPATVYKLPSILMLNNIINCGNFDFL